MIVHAWAASIAMFLAVAPMTISSSSVGTDQDAPEVLSFRVLEMGGVVSQAQAKNGNLYVASGHNLTVYAENGKVVTKEVVLPGTPRQMSVDGNKIAVAIGASEVYVLDLYSLATEAPHIAPLSPDDIAASITLVPGFLSVGTTGGDVVIFLVPEKGEITLVDRIATGTLIEGQWQIAAMGKYQQTLIAAIHSSSQGRTRGALVAVKETKDKDWVGSIVATYDDHQQPQQVEVIKNFAFVMTVTDVLAVNLDSSQVKSTGMGFGAGTFPVSIAGGQDQLHLLAYTDPLPVDRTMMLTSLDVSDPENMSVLQVIKIDKDAWDGARLTSSEGRAYLAGVDSIRIYVEGESGLGGNPEHTLAIAAVNSAYLDNDQMVVASHRGFCGFDFSRRQPTWCSETGLRSNKLIAKKDFVIALSSPTGVFSAKIEGTQAKVLGAIWEDNPRHQFIDAVETRAGALALVDVNPPRAPKTSFRLDKIVVEDSGNIVTTHQSNIETPDCGRIPARLVHKDTWVGLLCGEQILEFVETNQDFGRVGTIQLPAPGTTIDLDGENLLVIGTTKGLVLYDRLAREKISTRQSQSPAGDSVLATGLINNCVVVVQGGLGMRTVLEYCLAPDGVYSGEPVYQFERSRDLGAVQVVSVDGGFVIVSGSGTAILIQRSTPQSRIFLPILFREWR